MKNNSGFTLIELLVVVLIIGILAAVALPTYQTSVEKARAAEALINLKALATAEDAYYMAAGAWSTDFSQLDITFGNNCSGRSCVQGNYYYDLAPIGGAGEVNAYKGSAPSLASFVLTISLETNAGLNTQKGDISCFYRGNAAWEKVCLALGGKSKFTHPNGNSGPFYLLNR